MSVDPFAEDQVIGRPLASGWQWCPKCKNGRGKYRRTQPWPPRTITCPRCKGTGVIASGEPQEPAA